MLLFEDHGKALVFLHLDTKASEHVITARSRRMIPRTGPLLIHPKQKVLIAFNHAQQPGVHPGNNVMADIAMYDFSKWPIETISPVKHDKILRQFGYSWYRRGILQHPLLGTAAAFAFLIDKLPMQHIGVHRYCFFFSNTTVYRAQLDPHKPELIGVKDIAAEVHPYKAEVLDYCCQHRSINMGGIAPTNEDRRTVNTRLCGDGKYLADLGPSEIHVWSFDEDEPLANEDPDYYRIRTERAHMRAIRRRARRDALQQLEARREALHQLELDRLRRRPAELLRRLGRRIRSIAQRASRASLSEMQPWPPRRPRDPMGSTLDGET